MNIEKKWTVLNLSVQSTVGEMNKVVSAVQWKVVYKDLDSADEVGEMIADNTYLGLPDVATFNEYSELTEERVIGWVHEVLGPEALRGIDIALTLNLIKKSHESIIIDDEQLPWNETV